MGILEDDDDDEYYIKMVTMPTLLVQALHFSQWAFE